MTDKLIEQINDILEADKDPLPNTKALMFDQMMLRILADAEALKAADELAGCVNALLRIARQYGEDSTVHELTRVALATFQATRENGND